MTLWIVTICYAGLLARMMADAKNTEANEVASDYGDCVDDSILDEDMEEGGTDRRGGDTSGNIEEDGRTFDIQKEAVRTAAANVARPH